MSVLYSSKIFLKKLFRTGVENRHLYTPKEKILNELRRRRENYKPNDHLLHKIKPTPEIQHLLEKPHLVFFRQVATPLHEMIRVIELAKDLDLDLCILEYHHDKFVSARNPYKLGLGKLPIHQFVASNGDDIYQNHTIVDFNKSTGKMLSEVETFTGERLVDFHHDFFNYITGININTISFDASNWFKQFSYQAKEYYESFLSLFVYHNVLAEVFLSGYDDEEDFTDRIVIPAFQNIFRKTKFKPLILNSQPEYEQTRLYWDCYPKSTGDFLRSRGYIKE